MAPEASKPERLAGTRALRRDSPLLHWMAMGSSFPQAAPRLLPHLAGRTGTDISSLDKEIPTQPEPERVSKLHGDLGRHQLLALLLRRVAVAEAVLDLALEMAAEAVA
jgi:hypothetical protein